MLIDWLTPGRVFSGFFQIDPKKAEKYFAQRDRTRATSEADNLMHSAYHFTMRVNSLNRNNGLFEAEGDDFYGSSSIRGQIRSNNIQFRKTYIVQEEKPIKLFEQADFIGSAIIIGDAMVAGGEYHPTRREWKKYEGIWQIDRNPDGRLAFPGWMDPKQRVIKPLRVKLD